MLSPLAVVGGVLLGHMGVLIWLQTHSFLPMPTNKKVALPTLSGYLIVPAPQPAVRQASTVTRQAHMAAPATVSAKRPRSDFVPATARLKHAAEPEPASVSGPEPPKTDTDTWTDQNNAGNQAATGSPESGGKGIDLALPPQFNPPPSIAHQVRRQLDFDKPSMPAVATGTITVTERRRNDGTIESRVTTPLGAYCLRTRSGVPPALMPDLPAYRTPVAMKCR